MSIQSVTIPNMIQGVSQQAALQRRDTQAEAQFDCINDPVDGCLARPGADYTKIIAGANHQTSFFYDIYRGSTEHYLVAISDGDMAIYDTADGTLCTLTFPDGKTYLDVVGSPKDQFIATTIDDYTFIANQETKPAMATTKSPTRPAEALFHFKSGSYLTKYQIAIIYNGFIYTWIYTTPDNSVSGNAAYITTNQLAATFYRALTGSAATVTTSGTATSGAQYGVGAADVGQTGAVGAITATSLGFSVELSGSVIRVWRASDSNDFDIDTGDGVGDTQLIGIKDNAKSFSRLPNGGFQDFLVKVKGESKSKDDDYYVSYIQQSGTTGFWEETVAADTFTSLDATTMPHQLVNIGYRDFRFEKAVWGDRLVGDTTSSKDPNFVGKKIEDMFYDNNRLGVLTEGRCAWSAANNPYGFFPDTVQTILDTAPVYTAVSGGSGDKRRIALLRKAVFADESLFLWAQKAQFRVSTKGNEAFKADTIDVKPSTSFEFAEGGEVYAVGRSLYWATEPGAFAKIRDLFIRDGKPADDPTDVTAHAPKYIPAGVRFMSASDTRGLMVVTSQGAPSRLYIYNWLVSANASGARERIQSAWNTWRLPTSSTILWASVFGSSILLAVHRSDGMMLLKVDISQDQTDAEGDYLTRMDFKITEATLVSRTYDSVTGQTTLTFPFVLTEAESTPSNLFVAGRVASATFSRGTSHQVVSVSGAVAVVKGDLTAESLYLGLRISAERTESEFFLRSDKGAIHRDFLQVQQIVFTHAKSGYYRAETTLTDTRVMKKEFEGRVLGDPGNTFGSPVLNNGSLTVPVNRRSTEFTLKLINDSFLPSAWQAAEYRFVGDSKPIPRNQR